MNSKELENLKALRPCPEGLAFARQHPDLADAWDKCQRSDWMLWYLRQAGLLDKPTAVQMTIAFAERVVSIYEARNPGNPAPRKAIEAAKLWLANPCEENRKAAAAYADAAAVSAAAVSADAVSADAVSADAYAAAYTAYTASAAASDAAYASDTATTYAAAYAAERAQQCDIIRSLVPNPFLR